MSENIKQSKDSSSPTFRKIGKITGVHGLRGEVFIHVFSKDISWIDGLKEVILEDIKSVQRKSYKVTSHRPHKEGFLAQLQDVKDRNDAELIRGQLVYVDGSLFVTDRGDESFYLSEIENFKVYDGEKFIGGIIGFSSNSAQDLIVVEIIAEKDEVLRLRVEIPLVEDFLEFIDFEKGEVHMLLPPGLIESQTQK